ncbi:hypothetical protein CR159_01125 [Pollutimonas subterranea]|uniref:Uncharacterized protein n=1 Tax=Pollutimonas subterranea TaxID=2045210 RepID=A0A2N4U9G2_9BURK|nr:hypothetical protein [Pollutimonas subterranea]PLC51660.1 hypothetical protein CR159_01125 [Pollutimonas subterranea]
MKAEKGAPAVLCDETSACSAEVATSLLIYITNMFQFGRLRPNADIKMLQSEGLLIVIGCLA